MKNLALFLILTLLSGCQREKSSVTPSTTTTTSSPSCTASQNWAKTTGEAAQRLIGEWKLHAINGGFTSPPAVPGQSIVFSKGGTCVITQDGQRSGALTYEVGTINFVGIGTFPPSLTVSDTMQTASKRLQIGGPVALFVCDDQLVLDYGTPVDAQAYTYQRVR